MKNFLKKLINMLTGSRKQIGILSTRNTHGVHGQNTAYIEYFSQFGDVIQIEPLNEKVWPVDLLVLPGGPDVNPMRYGQRPHFMTGNPNIQTEFFDQYILPKYIAAGTAIFGICRGHQTLAVEFDAKLNQHGYYNYSIKSRDELVDTINIYNDRLPFHCDMRNVKINSIHHQVVDGQTLNDRIVVLAIEKDFHNIEALGYITNPNEPMRILSVQWHPEECHDNFSDKCINYLLSLSSVENNVQINHEYAN